MYAPSRPIEARPGGCTTIAQSIYPIAILGDITRPAAFVEMNLPFAGGTRPNPPNPPC